MLLAVIGIFAMFLGFVGMMNASPPDTGDLGGWVFTGGVVMTLAAALNVISEALF